MATKVTVTGGAVTGEVVDIDGHDLVIVVEVAPRG